MKQDLNHRAGGKNNRSANSKQACKSTGATQRESTTEQVCVNVPLPNALADALFDALRGKSMHRDAFILDAVRDKIARVDKKRAVLNVPDARLLSNILSGLEDAEDVVRGLFFLLVSHLEKGSIKPEYGIEPNETEVCGIMKLGHLASGIITKHRTELRDLYEAIGGAAMVSEDARAKLAAMKAARENVERAEAEELRVANERGGAR